MVWTNFVLRRGYKHSPWMVMAILLLLFCLPRASDGRTMKWEACGMNRSWPTSSNYFCIRTEGLRKTKNFLNQENRCPAAIGPCDIPQYKLEASPPQTFCSDSNVDGDKPPANQSRSHLLPHLGPTSDLNLGLKLGPRLLAWIKKDKQRGCKEVEETADTLFPTNWGCRSSWASSV